MIPRAVLTKIEQHFERQRQLLIEEGAPPEVADEAVRIVRQRVERRASAQIEFLKTEETVGRRQ